MLRISHCKSWLAESSDFRLHGLRLDLWFAALLHLYSPPILWLMVLGTNGAAEFLPRRRKTLSFISMR